MVSDNMHPSGAEEWYCPTCGRRILFQSPPDYDLVVLDEGDKYAIHSGSKGGLSIMAVQPASEEEPPLSVEDELTLRPWLDWLNTSDFEGLWDK